MLAGNAREALLAVADQLSIELGYVDGDDSSEIRSSPARPKVPAGLLGPDDEALVAGLRQGLRRVAVAAGEDSEGNSAPAVGAALDSVESLMRGEIICGNAARLPALMPSFVFLVALPIVTQDIALALSRRTARLLEEALEA